MWIMYRYGLLIFHGRSLALRYYLIKINLCFIVTQNLKISYFTLKLHNNCFYHFFVIVLMLLLILWKSPNISFIILLPPFPWCHRHKYRMNWFEDPFNIKCCVVRGIEFVTGPPRSEMQNFSLQSKLWYIPESLFFPHAQCQMPNVRLLFWRMAYFRPQAEGKCTDSVEFLQARCEICVQERYEKVSKWQR
jgi:hypothetical protein